MSKRVPICLSVEELTHIVRSLEEMPFASTNVDSSKLTQRLEEEIERNLEADMYEEDDDGYESLTEEAKEGLIENEAWLRSDK